MSVTLASGQRTLVMAAALGVGGLTVLGTGVPMQREFVATPLGTIIRFAGFDGPTMLAVSTITGPEMYSARSAVEAKPAASESLVVELKRITGFTWDQLAKALGVSRRTIHLWAAGGNMTAANQETTSRLISETRAIEGSDEGDRRLKLFELLDRERAARATSDTDINRPAPLYPTFSNLVV